MSAEAIVAIIAAFLASQGLWSLILYKVKRKDNKEDTCEDAHKKLKELLTEFNELETNQICLLNDSIQAVLHDSIYKECERLIQQGWVHSDDLKNLEYMYKPYKELGGNGTAKTLYEKVNKLEVKI